jgi:hypothetical protein
MRKRLGKLDSASYLLLLACTLAALHCAGAFAQQHRYMDSSGNIHFVDSLSQVPQRYREQVVPPTPTPVLDRRGLQMKKRAEMQAARQKMMEDKRKRAEQIQAQREQARDELRKKRQLQRERQSSSFPRN